MQPKRYTVTAALPYANGPVHIGHVAGVYLPADIYVRYLRSNNRDVKFICGSDEHGVPITIRAQKEGVTPQQVVDKYHKLMGMRSAILIFPSMFIRAPQTKRTIKPLLNFLQICTIMANL